MKKHIFSRFFIVTSFALLIAAVISAFILGNNMEKKTQHDMLRLLKVMEQGYSRNVNPNDFVKRNSKITDNSRITVIASDGTVIADSHVSPSSMENHLNRTEVKQALSSGWGVSNRNSSTLHKGLMYVAIKSESGDVIRIAQSFDGVFTNISKQVPAIFVALLIALLISLLISKRFSNTITRPFANIVSGLDKVSQGEYQIDFENTKYEELDTITNRIKSLLNEIKSSSSDLDKEREKVNFILDNMEEGLVLVDENQDILTVNNSAKNFFDCSEDVNKRNLVYLTDHIKIQNAVEDAIMKENSSLFDITLPDNRIVSIHTTNVVGKFIQNSKKHIGVIILIVDVSSDRKSHKLRQEFFSNASHELKTPITSIQGFAELIESGMIPDPSMQKEYLKNIITESKRMANLINDILMISRLEAGIRQEEYVKVNLLEICRQVATSVSPQASQQNISIQVKGNDTDFYANPNQMLELVTNIISNAVKYNKPSGSVKVEVFDEPARVKLKVSDTGIGIPQESQSRIFERFYRVDKGRSKKIGGTGLGLSIVKHIVNSYNGKIALKSMEDVGTTITVTLYKPNSAH